MFDHGLSLLTDWNVPALTSHLLAFAFCAWPVVGLQWRGVRGSSFETSLEGITPTLTNRVDVLAILTALNLFFALFFAGGLVLCVLLTMNSFAHDGSLAVSKAARRLSWSLMSLVGVVLASAVVRMALYVSVFGASTERVYAFGAMSWLVVVFALFGATVLRRRSNGFAMGTLAISAAFGLLFNIVNTEALVTRYDLRRAAGGAGSTWITRGHSVQTLCQRLRRELSTHRLRR